MYFKSAQVGTVCVTVERDSNKTTFMVTIITICIHIVNKTDVRRQSWSTLESEVLSHACCHAPFHPGPAAPPGVPDPQQNLACPRHSLHVQPLRHTHSMVLLQINTTCSHDNHPDQSSLGGTQQKKLQLLSVYLMKYILFHG